MQGERAGTAATDAGVVVRAGPLSATLAGGAVRWIRVGDVEVVRGIDYPIRDADWGTMPTRTVSETLDTAADGFAYRRAFRVDNAIEGVFTLDGTGTTLAAGLELAFRAPLTVNRAGFVVLHPLSGVAGTEVVVTGPDGAARTAEFPALISPGQPMKDIAALAHTVHGVPVELTFEGEVFETEDQRNWTDASFKTYCRPLSLPRPYTVAAGESVRQRVTLTVGAAGAVVPGAATAAGGAVPLLTLAFEPALSPLDDAAVAALATVPFDAVQVRLSADDAPAALVEAARLRLPLDLEIVVPPVGTADALAAVAAACREAGLTPRRVAALPAPYLASVQPEGPWPDGTNPAEAAALVRDAFPGAEVAAGVLTNFTELNRCRPAFASDVVTFGTAAIVHAADDASVAETLEALPAVFATARQIAGSRPLCLGLCAIAMRSNPYGSGLAANPHGARVTMTAADPRHAAPFAAAFAVGVAAAAARAGVRSFAPAMATGPLGLVGPDGVAPLFHVVHALARLSGRAAEIEGGPGGLVVLRTAQVGRLAGIAANLSARSLPLPAGGVPVPEEATGADWLDRAAPYAGGTLAPMTAAILFAERHA